MFRAHLYMQLALGSALLDGDIAFPRKFLVVILDADRASQAIELESCFSEPVNMVTVILNADLCLFQLGRLELAGAAEQPLGFFVEQTYIDALGSRNIQADFALGRDPLSTKPN